MPTFTSKLQHFPGKVGTLADQIRVDENNICIAELIKVKCPFEHFTSTSSDVFVSLDLKKIIQLIENISLDMF